MAARHPNLPGIDLILMDGNLVAIGDRPLTQSLLIIGPALDGPTDAPVPVRNGTDISTIFGPVRFNDDHTGPASETAGFSGNYLVKAAREALSAGAQDVRLMRVGGTKATGILTSGVVGATGTITFTAKYGGKLYNTVSVQFTSGTTNGQVVLTQPSHKGGNVTITWSAATSAQTVLDIIHRINSHVRNNTLVAKVGTISSTVAARLLVDSTTLASGTNGTVHDDLSVEKEPLYTNLNAANTGTFALLDDYEVDVIYLAGIYIDDAVDGNGGATSADLSVAGIFTDYIGKRSVEHPIIGVLGTRPLDILNDIAERNTHYEHLIAETAATRATGWLKAGYFMKTGFSYSDANTEGTVDTGAYLQVVGSDGTFRDPDLGTYVDSLASVYAGFITTLPAAEAATHKPVKAISRLPWEFTRSQLNTLVGGIGADNNGAVVGGGGYVTAKFHPGVGILWVKDVTSAARDSDFKDLQVLRIANAVHRGVKVIAFPFLGRPGTIDMKQSMRTEIISFLDDLADEGALLGKEGVGYTIRMNTQGDPLSTLLGLVEIEITLKPAIQIKTVRVTVKMSL